MPNAVDARLLTSGGNVGTGAEGSVKGARILISTQEAASVIGDYIAVRADYFDANREAIARMVNLFFQAEEAMRQFMAVDGDPQQTPKCTPANRLCTRAFGKTTAQWTAHLATAGVGAHGSVSFKHKLDWQNKEN